MSQGGPKPSQFYIERSLLTRAPATPNPLSNKSSNFAYGQNDPGSGQTNPGDGLVISQSMAIVVSVYPGAPGNTLSGGGSLLCWVYNPYQAIWTRCDDFDIDMSTTSGFQAWTKGAFSNASRLGMLILWAASGVTATTADIVIRLDGFTSVGGQAV